MYISSAGRIEMKGDGNAGQRAEQCGRAGVIFRMKGAMKPPIIRIKLWKNTQTRPADQPFIGSPVFSVIGSMITKVDDETCAAR